VSLRSTQNLSLVLHLNDHLFFCLYVFVLFDVLFVFILLVEDTDVPGAFPSVTFFEQDSNSSFRVALLATLGPLQS